MNKYIIYCTEEQTKKALELGAPIRREIDLFSPNMENLPTFRDTKDSDIVVFIPTAEQITGWLEEQGIRLHIDAQFNNTYSWYVVAPGKISALNECATRKEATLAAIDAALDYLSKNKK